MGEYAEEDWYKELLADLKTNFGDVPPPWVYAQRSHPYSIGWRMGGGESMIMVFWEWWEGEAKTKEEKVAYFLKWPPPPRWLVWLAHAIFEDVPEDDTGMMDYSPWFDRLEALGFKGGADFNKDMDDPQWLDS